MQAIVNELQIYIRKVECGAKKDLKNSSVVICGCRYQRKHLSVANVFLRSGTCSRRKVLEKSWHLVST